MNEAARSRGMRNSFDAKVGLAGLDIHTDAAQAHPPRAWKGVSP